MHLDTDDEPCVQLGWWAYKQASLSRSQWRQVILRVIVQERAHHLDERRLGHRVLRLTLKVLEFGPYLLDVLLLHRVPVLLY